jgi:hypothetical protein
VAYTVPEILEPAKFKKLLATAEKEVPELIPFLAMAGFAGLRSSELVREYAEDQVLRWEDINWQKQLITVRHEVAKLGTQADETKSVQASYFRSELIDLLTRRIQPTICGLSRRAVIR